jgi:hypothetical protein
LNNSKTPTITDAIREVAFIVASAPRLRVHKNEILIALFIFDIRVNVKDIFEIEEQFRHGLRESIPSRIIPGCPGLLGR